MIFLPRRDFLLALTVVLIWAGHFAVIKLAVGQLEPLVALTLRFAITGLLFLPFARRLPKADFIKTVEIGIMMGVFHQGLLFVGLQLLDSASVAVLMQSQTVFAVLLGWLILKERFAWRTSVGLAISMCGLVVMLGVPDVADSPRGFILLMLSSLILSYSYICMRKLPAAHPATFIAIVNLASFPLTGALSLGFDGFSAWKHLAVIDWRVMGFVLAYQALVVSMSHVWWQQLLSRNEVARVTCFTLLTPLVAIIISVLGFGTPVTAVLIAGAAITMAGLGVVVIRRVQKHRNTPISIVE